MKKERIIGDVCLLKRERKVMAATCRTRCERVAMWIDEGMRTAARRQEAEIY